MLKKLKKKNPEATQRGDELIFNCPFCVPKDTKKHYYWNVVKEIGHCFKCNTVMDRIDLLKYIFGDQYRTALDRFLASRDDFDYKVFSRKIPNQINKKSPHPLPDGCVPFVKVEGIIKNLATAFLNSRGVIRRDFYLCPENEQLWSKIIFPITLNSEVIFYAGRKFINFAPGLPMIVPENKNGFYQKGDIVYGIDYVDFLEPVIVVEGIFDCLTTPNSVALLGKTMSMNQFELFMAQEPVDVVVMLDWDARKEASRVASRLKLAGKKLRSVRIASLPYDTDPNDCRKNIDEYIKLAKDDLDLSLDFSA